jgi:anti-anti-sigma regulatory factor
MAAAAARTPVLLNLTRAEAHQAATRDGLMLMDVDGVLDAGALTNWSQLLDSAIAEGATGLVVDLRGCHAIDWRCLWALVVATARLKRRGDGGIKLVTASGSPLERSVQAMAASRLPAYSSAQEALRSFRISRQATARFVAFGKQRVTRGAPPTVVHGLESNRTSD